MNIEHDMMATSVKQKRNKRSINMQKIQKFNCSEFANTRYFDFSKKKIFLIKFLSNLNFIMRFCIILC